MQGLLLPQGWNQQQHLGARSKADSQASPQPIPPEWGPWELLGQLLISAAHNSCWGPLPRDLGDAAWPLAFLKAPFVILKGQPEGEAAVISRRPPGDTRTSPLLTPPA